MATPRVSRQGLVGAVPTTLLMWWAPVEDGPVGLNPSMTGFLWVVYPIRTPLELTWGERLEAEAWRRVATHEAWDWQSRILMKRRFAQHSGWLASVVWVPDRWRVDNPVPVQFSPKNLSWEVESLSVQLPPPTGRTEIVHYGPLETIHLLAECTTRGHDQTRGRMRVRLPIQITCFGIRVDLKEYEVSLDGVEGWQPLCDALDTPSINEKVQTVIGLRVRTNDSGAIVWIGDLSWDMPRHVDFQIGVQIRAMFGETCLGSGKAMLKDEYPIVIDGSGSTYPRTYSIVEMTWETGSQEILREWPESVTIQVSGSAEMGEEAFVARPYLRAAAWTGRFEVALSRDGVLVPAN
ncbi:MAG: hypothetical protein AABZ53_07390 [Planctomycetota bacterium]